MGSVVRLAAVHFKRAAFKLNLKKDSPGTCICSLKAMESQFQLLKDDPFPLAGSQYLWYEVLQGSPVRIPTYLFVTFLFTKEWLSFI